MTAVMPKRGDIVCYLDKKPGDGIYGHVDTFDGGTFRIQTRSGAVATVDVNYFLEYFYILTEPNALMKNIL